MAPCPECGEDYEQLGQHWNYNTDHRPSFTQEQGEIVTGFMMGDGYLNRQNKNPRLVVEMVSKNYLEWIDDKFGVLGTGVAGKRTAEESARHIRESGIDPNAKEKNYQDSYCWRTRNLPELKAWNWYGDGSKRWPDDLNLTPTVLKHWYCGDGHYDSSGQHNRITIAMDNEAEHTDKVDKYFRRVNIPTPSNYDTWGGKCTAEFTVEGSRKLFEYMGSPPPDFEYKWPEEYR